MTKFLTAMTLIGLFAFKSYANVDDLKNLAEAVTQLRQLVTEMDTLYNKGQIKGDVKVIVALNLRTSEVLKYCAVIEGNFAKVAPPEVLTARQEARDRSIMKAESLLDTNISAALLSAQSGLVRNLENTKYCLGLTSRLAIRANISQGTNP
jgi:hypothetical protein